MIKAVEDARGLFAAFGDAFIQLIAFGSVLLMPKSNMSPAMLTIVNSDVEGFGPPGLGLGVNRFDNQ